MSCISGLGIGRCTILAALPVSFLNLNMDSDTLVPSKSNQYSKTNRGVVALVGFESVLCSLSCELTNVSGIKYYVRDIKKRDVPFYGRLFAQSALKYANFLTVGLYRLIL